MCCTNTRPSHFALASEREAGTGFSGRDVCNASFQQPYRQNWVWQTCWVAVIGPAPGTRYSKRLCITPKAGEQKGRMLWPHRLASPTAAVRTWDKTASERNERGKKWPKQRCEARLPSEEVMKTRAEGVNVSMCIKHIRTHAHAARLYI